MRLLVAIALWASLAPAGYGIPVLNDWNNALANLLQEDGPKPEGTPHLDGVWVVQA
jgi:hypothetical protein